MLDEDDGHALPRRPRGAPRRRPGSPARPGRWPARRAGGPWRVGGEGAGQLHHARLAGGQTVGAGARRGRRCRAARAARRRPRPARRRLAMSAARRTFSRTVSSPNGSRRWNVRASPWRARLNGASRVTSRSPRRTDPVVGGWRPQITLKSVVLPAPLGPMRPVMAPASASKETSSRARRPPKLTVTSRTSRALTSIASTVSRPRARSTSASCSSVSGASRPAHSSGQRFVRRTLDAPSAPRSAPRPAATRRSARHEGEREAPARGHIGQRPAPRPPPR